MTRIPSRVARWLRRPWTIGKTFAVACTFGALSPLLHALCRVWLPENIAQLAFLGLLAGANALLHRQAWGQPFGRGLRAWLATAGAAALWVGGLAGLAWCHAEHVCMGGHMDHPPYPGWHHALDAGWALAMVGAAAGLRLARAPSCIAFGCVTAFVLAYRFVFGSFGGVYLGLPL